MRGLIKWLHSSLVFRRRISAIADAIALHLRPGEQLLDIGCGSGQLAVLLRERLEDLHVRGVETLLRTRTQIPVTHYDGKRLPYPEAAFDVSILVDVLHHADDPLAVMKEARRVSRRAVIVKDHVRSGRWSHQVLSFMDWVGNAPHGVDSKYHYFDTREWAGILSGAGLRVVTRNEQLGLYPGPARALFERNYHFVAVLEPVPECMTESRGCP
jgi:SAM-dependent methyltransferase